MNQHKHFQHYMLKEIYEQPLAVSETAQQTGSPDLASTFLERIPWSLDECKALNRISIAASGTSRHAGIAGKFMLEALARIPTEVDFASEFQHWPVVLGPETLMLVITQSGETADTLGAMRKAKKGSTKVLAVSNVAECSIMREADVGIHTKAGPELSVPSTKAFTAQLAALYLLALRLGEARGYVSTQDAQKGIAELMLIPEKLKSVLELDQRCLELARKYCANEDFLFAGRGVHYAIAMDGALKLKEVSYIHAEGYPSGEILHGPLALIDERVVVVTIATCDPGDAESMIRYEKTISNIKEFKGRSGKVVALACQGDRSIEGLADDVLYIPAAPDMLSPILEIVPLQLLAYHIAVLRGLDVDRPRSLAKAVIRE
jgi:glucosamine--fructose-6-phosphate aminotransferase (isomerizing)